MNNNQNKDRKFGPYGDERPRLKHFLIVLFIFLIITALAWLGYYKFHWLQ